MISHCSHVRIYQRHTDLIEIRVGRRHSSASFFSRNPFFFFFQFYNNIRTACVPFKVTARRKTITRVAYIIVTLRFLISRRVKRIVTIRL